MVLGYDQPRPTAKDYQDFMSKLVKGLEKLGDDGSSLMLYGSYVREDYATEDSKKLFEEFMDYYKSSDAINRLIKKKILRKRTNFLPA